MRCKFEEKKTAGQEKKRAGTLNKKKARCRSAAPSHEATVQGSWSPGLWVAPGHRFNAVESAMACSVHCPSEPELNTHPGSEMVFQPPPTAALLSGNGESGVHITENPRLEKAA